MALTKVVPHVEIEGAFLAGAVKIMQCPQSVIGSHFNALGAKSRKVCGKIRANSCKICTGFLDILLGDSDGDILFLHDPVGIQCFIKEHLVVLLTVFIQAIILHRHENGLLKVLLLHAVIVDGDLGRRAAVQRVQKFGIGKKHGFLVLAACYQIIDISELPALHEFAAYKEDPVRPDSFDRDYILNPLRNLIFLFVRAQDRLD